MKWGKWNTDDRSTVKQQLKKKEKIIVQANND